MTGTVDVAELAAVVAEADSVVAVGARTHWEVGGAPDPVATNVTAPAGVIDFDPRDLTITVGAGTTVAALDDVLAEQGQECPLDPRDPSATVGGVLATGLSGLRRLRYGPVRDRVLEVRFVTADGRVVKGGGPTVKNVTGFDIPRLMVGSFGTLGVLVQVTLRCQPRPVDARWFVTTLDPMDVRRRTYRPSCIAWDGRSTRLLLEGVPADIAGEAVAVDGVPDAAPVLPEGAHRGRISLRPGALVDLASVLDHGATRWLAEVGVGTVHVATDNEPELSAARRAAETLGGWMVREAGAPGLDGFGAASPNATLMERIRAAFDPDGKLGRGRLDTVLARRDVQLEGLNG